MNSTKFAHGVFESHGILFLPEAVDPVRNNTLWENKPSGGFWASPADSDASWRRWCLTERFDTESLEVFTRFSLADDARICVIANDADLFVCEQRFPREGDVAQEAPSFADAMDACHYLDSVRSTRGCTGPILSTPSDSPSHGMPRLNPLNFAVLLNSGEFDALLVRPRGVSLLRRWSLHSWDCDTLLVSNPKVVRRIQYFLYGSRVDLDLGELERLHELRMRDFLFACQAGGRNTPRFLQRCKSLARHRAEAICQ